jgi:hypothetical protein
MIKNRNSSHTCLEYFFPSLLFFIWHFLISSSFKHFKHRENRNYMMHTHTYTHHAVLSVTILPYVLQPLCVCVCVCVWSGGLNQGLYLLGKLPVTPCRPASLSPPSSPPNSSFYSIKCHSWVPVASYSETEI